MQKVSNFNTFSYKQNNINNKTKDKVVFNNNNKSFGSSNPFATDILDIKTTIKVQNIPPQNTSLKQIISFLGDKVKLESIKAQLTEKFGIKEIDNICKAINKDNIDCVLPLAQARVNETRDRFYAYDIVQILECINKDNKAALTLLIKAVHAGETKQLNANSIRSTLKLVNNDSFKMLSTIINPESGEIDNRILMGLDISPILKEVSAENIETMIALWQAKKEDGTPKVSKYNVVQFAKNTKPHDIPLLFDLLELKDHNKRPLFNDTQISQILNCKRDNQKQLLNELKNLPNLNGERITTVISQFKDNCIDYLKQNINDSYRVDVLFALHKYSEEVPVFKIIESPDFNGFNNTEREQLAELYSKKEYKDVVKQVDHLNVPLLPKIEHRDDFMNYLLASLKQNANLERIPQDRTNHFKHHLVQLQDHLKPVNPEKNIDFNNIYDSENVLINLPEHLTDLKNDLNTLIYVLPETQSIFADSAKAKAVLTTLNALFNDETFNSLNDKEKEFAKLATILSYLPGDENSTTKDTALNARISISRLDYTQREQNRIFDLVKNQNWLENLTSKNNSLKGTVGDCFVRPGDFEILTAMAKAKITTGNSNNNISQYKKALTELKPVVNKVVSTSINLPQTQIPKARSLHLPYEEIGHQGRTNNKIVRMNHIENFEHIGFPQGTNRDNIYFIVHVVNENIDKMMIEEMLAPSTPFDYRDTVNYVNYIDSTGEGNFSASLISMDNNNVFINQRWGFVFDVDPANIAIASQDDVWSGFDKNENVFTNNVFSPRRNGYSENVKNELAKNLDTESVAKVFNDLYSKTSLPEIDQPVANSVKTSIDQNLMNIKEHNELLLRSPKVKAIFCKNSDPGAMPYTMRHYAETHDIPIIVFDKT